MKAKLVGLKPVDFVNPDTNEHIEGMTFHLVHNDIDVIGQCAAASFLSNTQLENLGVVIPENSYRDLVGTTVEIEYNRKGRIAGFVVGLPDESVPPVGKKQ